MYTRISEKLAKLAAERKYDTLKRVLNRSNYSFHALQGIISSWFSYTNSPFKLTIWGFTDWHYLVIPPALKIIFQIYLPRLSPEERQIIRDLIWDQSNWIEDGTKSWSTQRLGDCPVGRVQILEWL